MAEKKHNERCRLCKERVKEMLASIFGEVEANFDIQLPSKVEAYLETPIYDEVARIYRELQGYRGHSDFVRSPKLPRVDYFIPGKKIIVEFDESQHFSRPREISLSFYPESQKYGFSIEKWRGLSRLLNKRDNDPPYRDEQRAWYDTLRDFAPAFWGEGRIVRIYAGETIWCALSAEVEADIQRFKAITFGQE